jgi:hypothetical protein
MDTLFQLLSNLVLFLTLTTLVFACGAYAVLAMRRRKPLARRRAQEPAGGSALLRRYSPKEWD